MTIYCNACDKVPCKHVEGASCKQTSFEKQFNKFCDGHETGVSSHWLIAPNVIKLFFRSRVDNVLEWLEKEQLKGAVGWGAQRDDMRFNDGIRKAQAIIKKHLL